MTLNARRERPDEPLGEPGAGVLVISPHSSASFLGDQQSLLPRTVALAYVMRHPQEPGQLTSAERVPEYPRPLRGPAQVIGKRVPHAPVTDAMSP